MGLARIALCFVATAVALAAAGKINHIVVLMEENRSFDHLLGLYNGTTRGTRGRVLTNNVTIKDKKDNTTRETTVAWGPGAPYINMCDPDHNVPPTTYKLFGTKKPSENATETMSGFAEFEYKHQHDDLKLDYCNVMTGFTSEQLPVITALAENFVLMDNFFCSVPGPTWPNRMFFMQGSSNGLTETGAWYKDQIGRLFPGETIFDQVGAAGGSWSLYYDDAVWELFLENLAHQPEHLQHMQQFYADAEAGTLPSFSFINPRAGVNLTLGVGSNDMHPDHDVALGEALYHDVYAALRRSPSWNETLFILTFDEHGGFYDHVPPPLNIPSPGNFDKSYPDDFAFDRSGVRIPTILISPWLPKGMTLSDPPAAQKPAPNSVYELTSIMATTRKLLDFMNGTQPLTQRDAWAATFEHLFELLDTPRTDCPMDLPAPPPPSKVTLLQEEAEMPINPLQQRIMEVHANLAGVPYPEHIVKQGDVEAWVQHHFRLHVDRTMAWKASKVDSQSASLTKREAGAPATSKRAAQLHHDGSDRKKKKLPKQDKRYLVTLQPLQVKVTARAWNVWLDKEENKVVFSINITTYDKKEKKHVKKLYCLDHGATQEASFIGISLCYPSSNPKLNRDPSQQWTIASDSSYRPYRNQTLCMDNTYFSSEGGIELFLNTCNSGMSQSYSWQGSDSVQPGAGANDIDYGDGGIRIAVVERES
jgi:phospholipase C